jgi:hypothetical protein
VFRRKSADLIDDEPVTTESPVEPVVRKSHTPKKGEATPKRSIAGRRAVEPPPANRKEAQTRSRAKAREDRVEQRQAMMNGDERYLMARDKGPIRGLIRNIVDSRRNVGSIFILGILFVLFGSVQAMPTQVQIGANLLFLFLVLVLIVDSVMLCLKVRKLVKARFPKETVRFGSLFFYAIMRSISFRRLRVPRPRVKIGEAI